MNDTQKWFWQNRWNFHWCPWNMWNYFHQIKVQCGNVCRYVTVCNKIFFHCCSYFDIFCHLMLQNSNFFVRRGYYWEMRKNKISFTRFLFKLIYYSIFFIELYYSFTTIMTSENIFFSICLWKFHELFMIIALKKNLKYFNTWYISLHL